MFFAEDDYSIAWWPQDVTCVNDEMWAENGEIDENANESICKDAFDELAGRLFLGDHYGFIKMWQEAFLGDEMNIESLQCIDRQ